MKFSIIIPTLNEANTIQTGLQALQPLRKHCEIIVVDGGSSDNTVQLASTLADKVIISPRGRARQMNNGASHAIGDILIFLHVDTVLPENALVNIQTQLEKPDSHWGRFDIRLDSNHRLIKMVAQMMNWRSRLTGIATGDQVIFVKRSVFFDIGQYPDLDLMEDIALSSTLKKLSRPVCLKDKVTSSARRWLQHGILKTIMLMWLLRLLYFFGADPNHLAILYREGKLWKT
jgi:rSAM/selenodomain-associated transferase 2